MLYKISRILFHFFRSVILSVFRKEFKEGGETEGKEKRQAERAQRQKEREAKEKLEDDDDEEWVAIPTKEEKMRQLFDPKTEITHEVIGRNDIGRPFFVF